MNYRVVVRPAARRDVREAAEYLENQRTGYGSLFANEYERILRTLERNPKMYLQIAPDIRRALTRRFKYAVIFKLLPKRVDVFAVYHTSRDPSGWQSRL